MRKTLLLWGLALGLSPLASAQVSLTSISETYSQNFNTLASTGTAVAFTNNVTLAGWYSSRTAYNAGNGGTNTGALYSFGSTSAADRALGGQASGGTGTFYYGVIFQNNTGSTIYGLSVSFTGEQWRDGGSATPASQTMQVEYQISTTNPGNLISGTFTSVPSLAFTSPTFTNTGTGIALDGNLAANRTAKTNDFNLSTTPILPGEFFILRFTDLNDAGNDHGLAVDDFSLTLNNALPVELVSFTGAASGTTARLAWTTASETNNAGFYVEQQAGDVWNAVSGLVAGRGTTTERSDYAYTVTGLTAGRHTFRLRQVDTDGSVHYSAPATVEIGVDGEGRVTLLGQRAVRIETNGATTATVRVYDVLGRAVMTQAVPVDGTAVVELPMLSAGAYVVRVEGEGVAATKRLVVR